MALVLSGDQRLLRDSAEGFFADKAPVAALRKLRDRRDATGFDTALWQEMADMGFAGVLIDADNGGVDMGFVAAGLIAEQMGRNLTAAPFFSSAVLAATALGQAGSESQKAGWLAKIVSGQALLALALDEGAGHNPQDIRTRAETAGNGFKITGVKSMVMDGHVADRLIVAARTSGQPGSPDGISLFLVDPEAGGVAIERTIMVDAHNAARIDFRDVEIDGDALLGQPDGGLETLDTVLAAGRAVAAAELLGAGAQAFEITIGYLRERKQFGRVIGEFQALQHRAAHLYTELEIARSAVLAALGALDDGDDNAHTFAAMAKAKAGTVAGLAAQEGVQMHGGVGMTDEFDIGLYMKRIRVLQEILGNAGFHADRLARARQF